MNQVFPNNKAARKRFSRRLALRLALPRLALPLGPLVRRLKSGHILQATIRRGAVILSGAKNLFCAGAILRFFAPLRMTPLLFLPVPLLLFANVSRLQVRRLKWHRLLSAKENHRKKPVPSYSGSEKSCRREDASGSGADAPFQSFSSPVVFKRAEDWKGASAPPETTSFATAINKRHSDGESDDSDDSGAAAALSSSRM